jgi:hypothetical protein
LKAKEGKTIGGSFVLRVKMGEYEIELGGSRSEVLKTIEDLPSLMNSIQKAFDYSRPKRFATLTVKAEAPKEGKSASEKYPRISGAETCAEAILRLLETDWGKWRPRTVEELEDALKANGLEYPGRTIAGVLLDLVKQGKIRRWNTDSGYVYILAETEVFQSKR